MTIQPLDHQEPNQKRWPKPTWWSVPLVIGIVVLVGVLLIAVVVLPNNPATPAQLQAVLDSLEVYPEGGPTLVGDWGSCLHVDQQQSDGVWETVAWGGGSGPWYTTDPFEATAHLKGIELFCEASRHLNAEIRLPLLPPGEYQVCEMDGTTCVPVQIPPTSD
jgi:hypothetical protein